MYSAKNLPVLLKAVNVLAIVAVSIIASRAILPSPIPVEWRNSGFETVFIGLYFAWGTFALLYHALLICNDNMRVIGMVSVALGTALAAITILFLEPLTHLRFSGIFLLLWILTTIVSIVIPVNTEKKSVISKL